MIICKKEREIIYVNKFNKVTLGENSHRLAQKNLKNMIMIKHCTITIWSYEGIIKLENYRADKEILDISLVDNGLLIVI